MFAVLSGVAGVGLGWLTALAGSVKIINWLTVPTAAANLVHAVGGLFFSVSFYGVLQVTRVIGVAIIAIALPLLWWRFRHNDREALAGIAWVMFVVVLFAPAALPWYYSWPLTVVAPLPSHAGRSRRSRHSRRGSWSCSNPMVRTACTHGRTCCWRPRSRCVWRVLDRAAADDNTPSQYAIACARRSTSRA